ncbi:MAG: hypothetical protein JXA82_10555 [Sedimentisphaerales bacterium]|nr:hypothetical protein [Sedimentisphaerales bacterium]
MARQIVTIGLTLVVALTFLGVAGCETDAQNTALLGAAAGAGIGALAGGDTEATLIGAGVGAGTGYIIGNESDKKKTRQDIEAVRAEQNVVTVWITNSNNSRIPVRLTKSGPNYVGPQGEIYTTMPTEEQLKMVYGF